MYYLRRTTTIIFFVFLACLVGLISCAGTIGIIGGGNPHKMQYLIERNYLYNAGLSKPTEFIDIMGDSSFIKRIHIGNVDSISVKDFMVFDNRGNLVSVSEQKEENSIVEFRYDNNGKLIRIIPDLDHFSSLDYDSLEIVYKLNKPSEIIAINKGDISWTQDIVFDTNKEVYSFIKKDGISYLFDTYHFEKGKIVAEYHKNRSGDIHVDSINYVYENDKLVKKVDVFNQSTIQTTTYDNTQRPVQNITKLLNNDSIAWTDQYSYQLDIDRIPNRIVTQSTLGWTEEINFRWE